MAAKKVHSVNLIGTLGHFKTLKPSRQSSQKFPTSKTRSPYDLNLTGSCYLNVTQPKCSASLAC